MAKRWLFWYVDSVDFSFDRCWLWCLLCVRNCSQINNHQEWGFNGMSIFRLAPTSIDNESWNLTKRRSIRSPHPEKNNRECFLEENVGARENGERIISKKSFNYWWWRTWWAKPRFISGPKSSLLGPSQKRKNGSDRGQIYRTLNRENLRYKKKPILTRRCSVQQPKLLHPNVTQTQSGWNKFWFVRNNELVIHHVPWWHIQKYWRRGPSWDGRKCKFVDNLG